MQGVKARSAAFGFVLALGVSAFAHGGAYQAPPEEPPIPGVGPVAGPPAGGPTTGGPDARGPTTGGPDGGGPTTPGGGPIAGGGPQTGGGGGGGVTTPGIGDVPKPKRPKSSGVSPDHWTRWWYANRAFLLDVHGRVRDNTPTTPGGAAAAPDAEAKWRADACAALTKALADRDEDVSSSAAVALGKAGDGAATAALTKLFLDAKRQGAVREAAALGLGLLPPAKDDLASKEARLALQRIAADEGYPQRLRGFAVYALGLRGDPAAVPFLLDLSQRHAATSDVAAACPSALGLTKCAAVRQDLEEMLEGPRQGKAKERMRRVYAAQGLARLGDPASVPALRAVLDDDDEDVRRAAVLALGVVAQPQDKETAEALAHVLRQDRDRACRNMAAITLGRVDFERSEKELRWYYENSHALEQPFAALALGLLARKGGHAGVAKLLVRDLEERANADLRSVLCVAVGLAGDPAAAPVVRELAAGRGDPDVRAQAAFAIGLLGDRAAGAPVLRGMLKEGPSPAVCREAALGLGLLGDQAAVKILLDLVENGAGLYVQGAAAMALGRIGGPETSQSLMKLLADESRPGIARGMAGVSLGLLLDRTEGRGLASVCADLDWYAPTSTTTEVMDIL